ncbi:hypothetical protein HanXRQr2_Chr15g0674251 [Helianthus annuus]|uniref:Uncharacterized protein n=1 Tax=Helianthus annuus TaxID=4232 RepID=A0A9K3H1M8_HELAN|nr:hypothetical protein HanXRQr2_Chr15g0674251 [Helianthus annuus]KAJ0829727.1 hypothetical protein HanPSC8_Chr15g0647121 [Helianthus annuus]
MTFKNLEPSPNNYTCEELKKYGITRFISTQINEKYTLLYQTTISA